MIVLSFLKIYAPHSFKVHQDRREILLQYAYETLSDVQEGTIILYAKCHIIQLYQEWQLKQNIFFFIYLISCMYLQCSFV